ncbi:hypothetical protein CGH20_00105 [Vibrio parahaemolyticus]|nr:hypothetical protein CGH63_02590 [Vibrio parahaemolyticus]TOO39310.1 hypothetical protein CGH39_18205 [Vibrio parahaemolyticus]TOP37941.1 hypothetical protein CGH20_00105 [Vibrio parahaemolyticus]
MGKQLFRVNTKVISNKERISNGVSSRKTHITLIEQMGMMRFVRYRGSHTYTYQVGNDSFCNQQMAIAK